MLTTGLGFFIFILIQRAWLSDDAFISFRTIDNLLNGYGLVWNIEDRVQTFTHPLWLFLLALTSLASQELVFTTLWISIALTFMTVLLFITRLAVAPLTALFGLVLMALSNAFIDYSTSGLENPLSHLLLVVFFIIFFRMPASVKKIFWLSLVAGLVALNRLDLLLLVAPPLIYALVEVRQLKSLLYLAAGQVPLVAWEIFSLVYYGFPFPNTAYAKLGTGIPAADLAMQGIAYLRQSLSVDPITLTAIGSALLITILLKDWRNRTLAAGIGLYLLYMIKIGGDFMSGRFLAAPFLCSLVILARFDLTSLRLSLKVILFSTAIVLGLLSPTPNINFWEADLTPKQRSAMVNENRISNERRFYRWATGLLSLDPETGIPQHPYALDGLKAKNSGARFARRITVGMFAYYAGPQVTVLDELALGDALLARLPAKYNPDWRIGHFQRTIPDGYLDTLRSGQNRLADSKLAQYFDQLDLITRGDLLAPGRFLAIWKMNTRQDDHLIDMDTYRFPKLLRYPLNELSNLQDAAGGLDFETDGIQIDLDTPITARQIGMALGGSGAFEIVFLRGNNELGRSQFTLSPDRSDFQQTCVTTPARAIRQGYDKFRLFPLNANSGANVRQIIFDSCLSD
jgi:arabinofuranosyltransferase